MATTTTPGSGELPVGAIDSCWRLPPCRFPIVEAVCEAIGDGVVVGSQLAGMAAG